MAESTFYVHGYDKDADIYKTLAATESYENALTIGKALLYYHKNIKEICRKNTGEPFDWFEVSNKCGKRLNVFTTDNPEGEDSKQIMKNR